MKWKHKRKELLKQWTLKRCLLVLVSLLPSAVILYLRPFGMTWSQGAVTAFLLLAIIWWVSNLVGRTVTSIILLIAFCVFGRTPATGVFTFPLSENFIIIVLSYLFSEGIKNSGLLDKLLLPLLNRWATTTNRLLLSFLVINYIMIFVIPQSFSRIILVAVIYDRFFAQMSLPDRQRYPLMFCLHINSVFVNMSFLRGDLILNNALGSASGAAMSEGIRPRYMALPSLVFSILGLVAFRLIFRKSLQGLPAQAPAAKSSLTRKDWRNLVILLVIILLWATEQIHGISGTIIVLVGTVAMIPMGLLRVPDLRCIDIPLLIFLTAAFSIGSVMKTSGTAEVIFSQMAGLFPSTFSIKYLLIILVITMIMHMILGSSVTTLSVVVPSLMITCGAVVPEAILLFTIYIAASSHAILPYHNVLTMIGEGRGYFRSQETIRYGAIMTIPILLAAVVLYFGWWSLLGLV